MVSWWHPLTITIIVTDIASNKPKHAVCHEKHHCTAAPLCNGSCAKAATARAQHSWQAALERCELLLTSTQERRTCLREGRQGSLHKGQGCLVRGHAGDSPHERQLDVGVL